jgi:hypothetical protein
MSASLRQHARWVMVENKKLGHLISLGNQSLKQIEQAQKSVSGEIDAVHQALRPIVDKDRALVSGEG